MSDVVLEPAAQDLADDSAKPPYLYDLSPVEARKVLDDLQSAPTDLPEIQEKWVTMPAAADDVSVRIVKPGDASGVLPVVLCVLGGGWILGNAGTHDRLVPELAVGTGAAVVFVE